MVGPPQVNGWTDPFKQGLGLPNGQALFNAGGMASNAAPPQVNINPGADRVGQGGFKINVTRTASSDPVQNIINDIQNPLGNTNLNIGPQAPAAPTQQQQASQSIADQAEQWMGALQNRMTAPSNPAMIYRPTIGANRMPNPAMLYGSPLAIGGNSGW